MAIDNIENLDNWDIIVPLQDEKYSEYIKRILLSRENIKIKNVYQERHHITPKTLGGSNDSDNLIYLFPQEHYYAHRLLAIENPHEKGLQLAWWNMCQCTQNGAREYNISADDYALAREKAAKANSELRKGMKFSEEHKEHLCGHGKPVVNLTTKKYYASAKEAAQDTGTTSTKIIECCKGKRGSIGKDPITKEAYIWRYKGEEDKDFGFNLFIIVRKVECIETGEVYNNIREASRETGVGRYTIKSDCDDNIKKSRTNKKRLHFKYFSE